ncbi:MAG: dephospho-CoA kinase [Woeseia sp.]
MPKGTTDNALRIGLTGGIASGKSTVADQFAALGVPVIDTDVIARQVVEPGEPALAEIVSAFGEDILTDDGGLDRAAMRRIVFADDASRRQLEAILHPRIRKETMAQSVTAAGPYQVIVVPLLAESPMKDGMDRILVVDVPESVQLDRLLARDSESPEQARRIIAAQVSRADRLAIADDIIRNDGALADTKRQVRDLHQRYLALAGAHAD